jgi:thiol-disulfide isomerase/thioredoxin
MHRLIIVILGVITIIHILSVQRMIGRPFLVNPTRTISFHYTSWCGHCKTMKPVWERLAATGGAKYVAIDEDVAKTAGINSYPTIVMLAENGRRYTYNSGSDYQKLYTWAHAPVPYSG